MIGAAAWPGMPGAAAQALALLAAYPVVVLVFWTLRSAWQGWQLRALPSPPHGVLGVVGALSARKDRHRLILEWARALGPVFRMRQLFKQIIVCTHPAVVAEAVKCKQLEKEDITTQHFEKVCRSPLMTARATSAILVMAFQVAASVHT